MNLKKTPNGVINTEGRLGIGESQDALGWYPPGDEDSCQSCGAELGPSSTYPWHFVDEDCRIVREPDQE